MPAYYTCTRKSDGVRCFAKRTPEDPVAEAATWFEVRSALAREGFNASPGEWNVFDVDGQYSTCADKEFGELYEQVEAVLHPWESAR